MDGGDSSVVGSGACGVSDCRRACGNVGSVILCVGVVCGDVWHGGVSAGMVDGVMMSIDGERVCRLFMVAITATIGSPSTELIRLSRRQVC